MKIHSLYIYPIKSIGGASVNESIALSQGLQYDRKWMLIDRNGKFISQRSHPLMATLSCEIKAQYILCYLKDDPTQYISFETTEMTGQYVDAQVWKSKVKAMQVSKIADQWFSSVLGDTLRLVTMGDKSIRITKVKKYKRNVSVNFPDKYPYLVLSTESLDELNKKLEKPVSIHRFRPNIVLTGCTPHQEDDLQTITTKSIVLNMAKPCVRCSIICTDENTGQLYKEPARTLGSYRKIKNDILFGMNAICTKEGIIRSDEPLEYN